MGASRLARAAASALLARAALAGLASHVDPLLASRGGAGFGGWGCQARNPGAMAPFPMLRLGPDTTRVDPVLGEVWSHLNRHPGYFGSDNAIRAFSHTHVQGAGDADYGSIGLMPSRLDAAGLAGLVKTRPVDLFGEITLDRSPFLQRVALGRPSEEAAPGYYAVTLDGINTRAELVASGTHAGAHRYTCASGVAPGGGGARASGPCALVIDACHRAHSKVCGAGSSLTLSQASATAWTLDGVHVDNGEFVRFNYSGVSVFFHMEISATAGGGAQVAASESGLWRGYGLAVSGAGNASVGADLDSLGAYLVWPAPAADGAAASVVIEVRVGLSTVSAAAAAANLRAEQAAAGGGLAAFDDVAAAISVTWDALLGAVTVTPVADAEVATDAAALAAGLDSARTDAGITAVADGFAHADIVAEAALTAFLATPAGAAIALSHGWASAPAPLLRDIAAVRAGAAELRAALATAHAPAALTIDVERASRELRAGVAASRAAVAAARAADPLGTDLAVFATMLYLSFCAPSTYSDASGAYLGFDGKVHGPSVPGGAFVSDLSLWDTHRSQAPLLALVAPRALADTAGSLLDMTVQGSMGMPRWPFANLYTEDMVGRHGVVMLADCVLTSGACAGRVTLAAAAAAAAAAVLEQDASQAGYAAPGGYVSWPAGPASETSEYAYDDFAAAMLSAAAGNATLAAEFFARAQAWRNAFDPRVPALAPRLANGTFKEDAGLWQPHPSNPYYTEGSAAQWMWAVPHNLSALAAIFPGGPGPVGGRGDSFAAQLQVVLANQTFWPFSTFLPNAWAWLGNEPSMLLPWSHVAAGSADSWRTAFWPRWHLREYYTPSSDCIPGNDDYGTLCESR
jgi:putative alpha-1,2-mannosidase